MASGKAQTHSHQESGLNHEWACSYNPSTQQTKAGGYPGCLWQCVAVSLEMYSKTFSQQPTNQQPKNKWTGFIISYYTKTSEKPSSSVSTSPCLLTMETEIDRNTRQSHANCRALYWIFFFSFLLCHFYSMPGSVLIRAYFWDQTWPRTSLSPWNVNGRHCRSSFHASSRLFLTTTWLTMCKADDAEHLEMRIRENIV